MREYLIKICTQKIDEYLRTEVYKTDGVDGYSDLCHSFWQYLENDYNENGV